MLSPRGVVVRSAGAPAQVEELVFDPPGPGEALVRLKASGVCHTDLHAKLGNFTPEFPFLLGHEGAGVVEEGPAHLVGKDVVISWRAPCGTCRHCIAARPVLCAKPLVAAPRMRTKDGLTLGRVLGAGTFATHTIVHAAQCIPVGSDLDPAHTCLIGCCVATGVGAVIYASGITPGRTVVVYGCGAVGMSVIQGARIAQASRIIAVDLVPRKLEWARMAGATDAIDARSGDPARKVKELLGGVGADFVFEAVGLPQTLEKALASCDLGGTCVLIGVPAPGMMLNYPMIKLFYGRQNLKTTFCGDALPARDFPALADMARRGSLDLAGLVSARIGLDEVEAAFGAMERGETLRSVVIL
jgi:S-(hydroxymethyl)mycothiol dehydrogenase